MLRSRLPLLLVLACALVFAACDGDDVGGVEPGGFDRASMLRHVADNNIVPAYRAFAQATIELDAAVDAFATAPSDATLDAAQQALLDARMAWQDVSLFAFGPAEQGALRAAVNTYPVDVDQVNQNIDAGMWVLGSLANRAATGLPTMGYLLHGVGADDAEILAAYTSAGDADSRMAYLQDNSGFVGAVAEAVLQAWEGDYHDAFLSAEMAGVDVGSALGQMTNAMVQHYERFLRDGKIGIPAGVRSAGVPRPTATEAYFGGYSRALALANVRAVERLYLGNTLGDQPGSGYDDYVESLDADLAADIASSLADAVAAIQGLSDPLSGVIESDNETVLGAFTAMQRSVALLKADLASTLGVTITFQDNDGD